MGLGFDDEFRLILFLNPKLKKSQVFCFLKKSKTKTVKSFLFPFRIQTKKCDLFLIKVSLIQAEQLYEISSLIRSKCFLIFNLFLTNDWKFNANLHFKVKWSL